MALLTQAGMRSDPVLAHNFVVSLLDTSSALATVGSALLSGLLDVAVGGFSECQGLEASLKIEEYSEGGNNGTTLKFPTRTSWGNVVLKRGVTGNSTLWDWAFSFVEGRGKRRDGAIVLMDAAKAPAAVWFFRRGLPLKYSGPQMNAAQNNVAIESIEIAHEGLRQVPFAGVVSGLASVATGGGAGGLAGASVSGAIGL